MPVNDAPTANDDSFDTIADMSFSGEVLSNDNDVENDPLSALAGTFKTAAGGDIQIFGDGSFTYNSEFGFYGQDSFGYTVSDGLGGFDTATIFFNVCFLDTDIVGTEGRDKLHGSQEADRIFGLGGNDRIYGMQGVDWLDGGDGNDVIYGHNGVDTMVGGDGNDKMYGMGGGDIFYSGAGRDLMFGGNGQDTFIFDADTAFDGIDSIRNFDAPERDIIDISDLLQGYDPLANAISDFVEITEKDGNSILSVDIDGCGDNFVAIAKIVEVTGITDVQELIDNGNLVI